MEKEFAYADKLPNIYITPFKKFGYFCDLYLIPYTIKSS